MKFMKIKFLINIHGTNERDKSWITDGIAKCDGKLSTICNFVCPCNIFSLEYAISQDIRCSSFRWSRNGRRMMPIKYVLVASTWHILACTCCRFSASYLHWSFIWKCQQNNLGLNMDGFGIICAISKMLHEEMVVILKPFMITIAFYVQGKSHEALNLLYHMYYISIWYPMFLSTFCVRHC